MKQDYYHQYDYREYTIRSLGLHKGIITTFEGFLLYFRKGFIDAEQVKKLAEPLKKNAYGQYLLKMIKGY